MKRFKDLYVAFWEKSTGAYFFAYRGNLRTIEKSTLDRIAGKKKRSSFVSLDEKTSGGSEIGGIKGLRMTLRQPLYCLTERRKILGSRLYYTGEFALKASVSLRTLRYYDRVGLLSPSHYTEGGYRLYSDDDLLTLQQILALKFLGFSLKEIKACLSSGPTRLHEVLAMQKAMMRERRMQLDNIIQAISETQHVLREHAFDCAEENWQAIVKVIQAIQMEQNEGWVNKYFTSEQREMMRKLSEKSYSPEAAQKLTQRREWTEEDQHRADQQWGAVQAGVRQLTAQGADPASPEAQAVIEQEQALIAEFTQGDADIGAGLKNWWNNYNELPAEQKPFPDFYSKEELAFLEKAHEAYRQRKGA